MNKNDIKVGNKVWFQEYLTERIVYGIVEQIGDNEIGNDVVKIHGKHYDNGNSFLGPCWKSFKDIYKTKYDCINDVRAKKDVIVKKYKAEIVDLYSLINFPLEHNVGQCDEYTDYEAIRAYKERAAELGFDIDLENDIERD